MKTNEIEEAIIETAPEPKPAETASDADLMERLNVATERKEPTAETQSQTWDFSEEAPNKEPQKPQTEAEPQKKPDNNFSEAQKPKTAITNPTAVQPDNVEPKISKEAKHASARIAVAMLNITQGAIFKPLLNRKFKKKFTAPEAEKLDTLADIPKTSITDDKDLALRNKFDKLLKRHNKKIDGVDLEEQEEKDLASAFYTYMDVTGKSLPPEYLLMIALLNTVGKRSIDLFTD